MDRLKIIKKINDDVYEVEFENFNVAVNESKRLKKKYPNMICNGTGYGSKKYVIHLHKDWNDFLDDKIDENGKIFKCVNCNMCKGKDNPFWDSSMGIVYNRERCFGEEFWSDVYEERKRHFVKDNSVYYLTLGKGGFGNRRYNVKLEDGSKLYGVGLWHRGNIPKNLKNKIKKGTFF